MFLKIYCFLIMSLMSSAYSQLLQNYEEDLGDCRLTIKGSSYSGDKNYVQVGYFRYKCLQWSAMNIEFAFTVENKTEKPQFPFKNQLLKWVENNGHIAKNRCRNPGGLFDEPSCISSETESGVLRPCDIPLCNYNFGPNKGRNCLVTSHGREYTGKLCQPKQGNIGHDPFVKCICRAKEDYLLGPTYRSDVIWDLAHIGPNLPCNIPSCDEKVYSYVLSGGRDVRTWIKFPKFSQILEFYVKQWSDINRANLLMQLRSSPDVYDEGINFFLTPKLYKKHHKSFLAELAIGHIPIISDNIPQLGIEVPKWKSSLRDQGKTFLNSYKTYENILSLKKEKPGDKINKQNTNLFLDKMEWMEKDLENLIMDHRWQNFFLLLEGSYAEIFTDKTFFNPQLSVSTLRLASFPSWVRLQSDKVIELSFGNEKVYGCPAFLTFGRENYADVKGDVQKINPKLFKNISSERDRYEHLNEGLFIRLKRFGTYPNISVDLYVRGPSHGKVTFTIKPSLQGGLSIDLENSYTVSWNVSPRKQVILPEWQELQKHIKKQNISTNIWQRYVINIKGNIIELFKGSRTKQTKLKSQLKLLFILKMSQPLPPFLYLHLDGNMTEWNVGCVPETLNSEEEPPQCSLQRDDLEEGIGYQGNIYFGKDNKGNYELCKSWSFFHKSHLFHESQRIKSPDIKSHFFPEGVLVKHNFCRNLVTNYSSTPFCFGYHTGNFLGCSTTCSESEQRRTLLGLEYTGNVKLSRSGTHCLKDENNRFCKYSPNNLKKGAQCIVKLNTDEETIEQQDIMQTCSIPIKSEKYNEQQYYQFNTIDDQDVEYIDLMNIKDGQLTFGILPAYLGDFGGAILEFYDEDFNSIGKIKWGSHNLFIVISFKSYTKNVMSQDGELLSEINFSYFQISMSEERWILYKIDEKENTKQKLEQLKLSASTLARMRFLAMKSPRIDNKKQSKQSDMLYLRSWISWRLSTAGYCVTIFQKPSQQLHLRNFPLDQKQILSFPSKQSSFSSKESAYFLQFYDSLQKSEKSLVHEIEIYPFKGQLRIQDKIDIEESQIFNIKLDKKHLTKKQKMIKKLSFLITKLTPTLWFDLAQHKCPYILNYKNKNPKYIQKDMMKKIIEQTKKGVNANTDIYNWDDIDQIYEKNKSQRVWYIQSKDSEYSETVLRLSDLGKKSVKFHRKIKFVRFKPYLQDIQLNDDGEILARNGSQGVERLLLKQKFTLSTLPRKCRLPLWIDEWVMIIYLRTFGDKEELPVLVLGVETNSLEGASIDQYWRVQKKEKPGPLALQKGNCQEPIWKDPKIKNGQWSKPIKECSCSCGRCYGKTIYKCEGRSFNGKLCQIFELPINETEKFYSLNQSVELHEENEICNDFLCGELDPIDIQSLEQDGGRLSSQIERKQGESVILSCLTPALIKIHKDTRYKDKVYIFWFKNSQQYNHKLGTNDVGDLIFKDLEIDDSGLYQCLVTVGSTKIYLVVLHALLVKSNLGAQSVIFGQDKEMKIQDLSLFCLTQGFKCRVSWFKLTNDSQVEVGSSMQYTRSFYLRNISFDDLGVYKGCVYRYKNNTNETTLALKKNIDELYCIKYLHLKESRLIELIKKFLEHFGLLGLYDYAKSHTIACLLFIGGILIIWILSFKALRKMEEYEQNVNNLERLQEIQKEIQEQNKIKTIQKKENIFLKFLNNFLDLIFRKIPGFFQQKIKNTQGIQQEERKYFRKKLLEITSDTEINQMKLRY